jgi:hypothetical protein
VMLVFALSANAQELRVIVVDGYEPGVSTGSIEDYNNLLFDAIDADSTLRKTSPNVVYELKQGHQYPQGKIIKNYDYHLQIRGQEGDGFLPQLIPGKRTDGSYGQKEYLRAYNDVTLENLYVSGYRPDGAYMNRMLKFAGNNARIIATNVMVDGDRGAGFMLKADSLKVYLTDCTVGNCGHRKTSGGNGRIVDVRPEAAWVDTLIVINSTVHHASDRVIRNMQSEIGYFKLDHFTALNNVGFHGAIQLGKVRTAIITNSVFANSISLGNNPYRASLEQTQPEEHYAVITLDTLYANTVLEIRNNNIFSSQVIKDVWAKYDSVTAPWALTPTIEGSMGDAAAEAYFEEELSFTLTCDPITDYVDFYFANPDATEYPDNWCVGGQGGYFLDEEDLSYGTEAASYTAGDDGYPLGNLNYYPEMKTKWENGDVISGVETMVNERNSTLRNYPNPFNNTTIIAYELEGSSNVTLEVYDITGRSVKSLVNEYQSAGSHEVTFDAAGLSGGMYFYKLDSGSQHQVNNMIITK